MWGCLRLEHRLGPAQVPEALWSRLRTSFESYRNGSIPQPVAGRLDLAVSDTEIKVYEYNADSASCLYECGYYQGRWAEAVGLTLGTCPGEGLFDALVATWAKAGLPAGACLHVMYDDNQEEAYHAAYMCSAIAKAGIRTKMTKCLGGLHFSDSEPRQVVDADGEAIAYVWKTWSWETVFDVLAASADGTDHRMKPALGPSLADVLLDERVTVWEPLWTTITNNKAILPTLWEMFPNHPYLLRCEFELSDELKNIADGYVSKPIVGRCGSNITMHTSTGGIVAHLGGQFVQKNVVYQQTRALPRVDGKSVLVCPWAVDGKYGGIVIRCDEGLITKCDSALECLRVLPTEEFVRQLSTRASEGEGLVRSSSTCALSLKKRVSCAHCRCPHLKAYNDAWSAKCAAGLAAADCPIAAGSAADCPISTGW